MLPAAGEPSVAARLRDRKSTRLNSSHSQISYAVFCLKKKKIIQYFGAGRSSDSPGRRPAKRAQLNWANPCQNGTRTVLELRGARTSCHASIPGAVLD